MASRLGALPLFVWRLQLTLASRSLHTKPSVTTERYARGIATARLSDEIEAGQSEDIRRRPSVFRLCRSCCWVQGLYWLLPIPR